MDRWRHGHDENHRLDPACPPGVGLIDVEAAFDRGAANYDFLVSLNPGYRRHLDAAARELVSRIGVHPGGLRLLDLACGSGVSTQALAAAVKHGSVITGIDASAGMLDQARGKRWPDGVGFQQGHVGRLELADLGQARWHGVFASYLFRNVVEAERDSAIAQAHALLEPGGWLVTQEYSVAGNLRAKAVWDAVCWSIILPLATVVDRNFDLYRYLWRSVRRNESTARFMARLADAGFVDVACRTHPGWQRGILHTFVARKAPR